MALLTAAFVIASLGHGLPADAVGVHAVIAPKDRAVGLNATVQRVACGAADTVPYLMVTNLARTLRALRERDIWLVGTDDAATHSLHQVDARRPMAWVMGAELITASPHAPQKLQAANDLKRVYDLEHDRFMASERAFLQFPFLATSAYAFPLKDQRLDGDVAWDASGGNVFAPPGAPAQPRRIAASVPSFGGGDGVHMRRMWMLNNPVALVRAMMDPATKGVSTGPSEYNNSAIAKPTASQIRVCFWSELKEKGMSGLDLRVLPSLI